MSCWLAHAAVQGGQFLDSPAGVIQGFFGHDEHGRPLDGDAVLAAYFNCGAFWGNIEHVMSLTPPELQLYLQHAARIRSAVKQG